MRLPKVLLSTLTVAAGAILAAAQTIPAPLDEPLDKSNVYLPKVNSLVARSLMLVRKNPADVKKNKNEAFWLTWGYTAPESKYKGDKELGTLAKKLTGVQLDALEKKPSGYWSLIPALQMVEFWRQGGEVPQAELEKWLKQLRPSVVQCYNSQAGKTSWVQSAPNTLHQAAAGLQMAVKVYGRVTPREKDLKKWSALARTCIEQAEKMQLPGGAFSYINSSGPDPCYYNFDSTFLGVYYLLTGDRAVAESIAKMSGWSKSATRCGWLTAFASPWWKHFWGTGGPYFGPEIIAGVSKDPLTTGVMQIRRKKLQPYYFIFYAMYYYDKNLQAKPVADRCEFDLNSNGAALRRGNVDIEMPFRSWCDSTGGIAVSTPDQVRSYLTSVVLTPLRSKSSHFKDTFGVVNLDQDAKRTTICGSGFIAQAVTFRPVKGLFGGFPSGTSPWKRTDIWYADGTGIAGVLSLECLKDNPCYSIETWVRTSGNFKLEKTTASSPDMAVDLTAEPAVKLIRPGKDKKFAKAIICNEKRVYKAGERFSVKVAANTVGTKKLAIGKVSRDKMLIKAEVLKANKKFALLVYNHSAKPVKYQAAAGSFIAYAASAGDQTGRKQDLRVISLPPNGMIIVKTQ